VAFRAWCTWPHAFDTLTIRVAVAELPAASHPTAANVWEPAGAVVVFQAIVYGDAVSSGASSTPSSLNSTPATPTLSVAVALNVVVPETVALAAGAVMETTGGVESTASVANVTSPESARFPAASFERARMW